MRSGSAVDVETPIFSRETFASTLSAQSATVFSRLVHTPLISQHLESGALTGTAIDAAATARIGSLEDLDKTLVALLRCLEVQGALGAERAFKAAQQEEQQHDNDQHHQQGQQFSVSCGREDCHHCRRDGGGSGGTLDDLDVNRGGGSNSIDGGCGRCSPACVPPTAPPSRLVRRGLGVGVGAGGGGGGGGGSHNFAEESFVNIPVCYPDHNHNHHHHDGSGSAPATGAQPPPPASWQPLAPAPASPKSALKAPPPQSRGITAWFSRPTTTATTGSSATVNKDDEDIGDAAASKKRKITFSSVFRRRAAPAGDEGAPSLPVPPPAVKRTPATTPAAQAPLRLPKVFVHAFGVSDAVEAMRCHKCPDTSVHRHHYQRQQQQRQQQHLASQRLSSAPLSQCASNQYLDGADGGNAAPRPGGGAAADGSACGREGSGGCAKDLTMELLGAKSSRANAASRGTCENENNNNSIAQSQTITATAAPSPTDPTKTRRQTGTTAAVPGGGGGGRVALSSSSSMSASSSSWSSSTSDASDTRPLPQDCPQQRQSNSGGSGAPSRHGSSITGTPSDSHSHHSNGPIPPPPPPPPPPLPPTHDPYAMCNPDFADLAGWLSLLVYTRLEVIYLLRELSAVQAMAAWSAWYWAWAVDHPRQATFHFALSRSSRFWRSALHDDFHSPVALVHFSASGHMMALRSLFRLIVSCVGAAHSAMESLNSAVAQVQRESEVTTSDVAAAAAAMRVPTKVPDVRMHQQRKMQQQQQQRAACLPPLHPCYQGQQQQQQMAPGSESAPLAATYSGGGSFAPTGVSATATGGSEDGATVTTAAVMSPYGRPYPYSRGFSQPNPYQTYASPTTGAKGGGGGSGGGRRAPGSAKFIASGGQRVHSRNGSGNGGSPYDNSSAINTNHNDEGRDFSSSPGASLPHRHHHHHGRGGENGTGPSSKMATAPSSGASTPAIATAGGGGGGSSKSFTLGYASSLGQSALWCAVSATGIGGGGGGDAHHHEGHGAGGEEAEGEGAADASYRYYHYGHPVDGTGILAPAKDTYHDDGEDEGEGEDEREVDALLRSGSPWPCQSYNAVEALRVAVLSTITRLTAMVGAQGLPMEVARESREEEGGGRDAEWADAYADDHRGDGANNSNINGLAGRFSAGGIHGLAESMAANGGGGGAAPSSHQQQQLRLGEFQIARKATLREGVTALRLCVSRTRFFLNSMSGLIQRVHHPPAARHWRRVSITVLSIVPVFAWLYPKSPAEVARIALGAVRTVGSIVQSYAVLPAKQLHEAVFYVRPGVQERRTAFARDAEALANIVRDYHEDCFPNRTQRELDAVHDRCLDCMRKGVADEQGFGLVEQHYRDTVKNPVRSSIFGDLPRIILIQMSYQALEMSRVTNGLDEVLEGNDLNFKVMALMPVFGALAIGSLWVFLRWRATMVPVRQRMQLIWRAIYRVVTLAEGDINNGNDNDNDDDEDGGSAGGNNARRINMNALGARAGFGFSSGGGGIGSIGDDGGPYGFDDDAVRAAMTAERHARKAAERYRRYRRREKGKKRRRRRQQEAAAAAAAAVATDAVSVSSYVSASSPVASRPARQQQSTNNINNTTAATMMTMTMMPSSAAETATEVRVSCEGGPQSTGDAEGGGGRATAAFHYPQSNLSVSALDDDDDDEGEEVEAGGPAAAAALTATTAAAAASGQEHPSGAPPPGGNRNKRSDTVGTNGSSRPAALNQTATPDGCTVATAAGAAAAAAAGGGGGGGGSGGRRSGGGGAGGHGRKRGGGGGHRRRPNLRLVLPTTGGGGFSDDRLDGFATSSTTTSSSSSTTISSSGIDSDYDYNDDECVEFWDDPRYRRQSYPRRYRDDPANLANKNPNNDSSYGRLVNPRTAASRAAASSAPAPAAAAALGNLSSVRVLNNYEQGMVLVLVHLMRSLACEYFRCYPFYHELLEDLDDLESMRSTRHQRLETLRRMSHTHRFLR